jgi:hypothetical protein
MCQNTRNNGSLLSCLLKGRERKVKEGKGCLSGDSGVEGGIEANLVILYNGNVWRHERVKQS